MMKPNPGKCPPEARGRRVIVKLASGKLAKGDWAADTTRWTITGSPFDVANWKILG